MQEELLEQGEFNTCPEGYDYVDAEQARQLLRPETRRQECRGKRIAEVDDEGDDDDEGDGDNNNDDGDVKLSSRKRDIGRTMKRRPRRQLSRKKEKRRVIGAAGYLEASLFGSEVSSSSSLSSSSDSGGNDADGIIRTDALKDFM